MAGNITNELVGKLGMKNLSKGIRIEVLEDAVSVDLSLTMKYGYNIPAVSAKVSCIQSPYTKKSILHTKRGCRK